MSVSLEVGRQYVSSSNKIVKIVEAASSSLLKDQILYLGSDGCQYTSSGEKYNLLSVFHTDSFFTSESLIQDFDQIVEDFSTWGSMKNIYPGSVTIKVEDPPRVKDKLSLKVEGNYKTNSGNKVTILSRFSHRDHLYYIASDGRLYSEDDQRYLSSVSSDIYQNDPIISEWVTIKQELSWRNISDDNPCCLDLSTLLSLEVDKSYHSESGKVIRIVCKVKDHFIGDDHFVYTLHGKSIPRYEEGKGMVSTEDLKKECETPPTTLDPIEYLNSLPSFTQVVFELRESLQKSGHCGETTSEKISRQNWNEAVKEVCDRLLRKS